MRNANKSPKIPYFTIHDENGKMIQKAPYPGPDQHQKLITSRGSPYLVCRYSKVI